MDKKSQKVFLKFAVISIFLLFLLLIIYVLWAHKYSYDYANNIIEVMEITDLNIDVPLFETQGKVFYIYRRNVDGRKYLNVYGIMSRDALSAMTDDVSFRTIYIPGDGIVELMDELPPEMIARLSIVKPLDPNGPAMLTGAIDGNIVDIRKVTKRYYLQMRVSDSTGAFHLRIISPPRSDTTI